MSHSRTRLQGDPKINHVLDTTLQREQNMSNIQNKLRTTSVVENTFKEVLEKNLVNGDIPTQETMLNTSLQYLTTLSRQL